MKKFEKKPPQKQDFGDFMSILGLVNIHVNLKPVLKNLKAVLSESVEKSTKS